MSYEPAPRPESYEVSLRETRKRRADDRNDRNILVGLCLGYSGIIYTGAVLFGSKFFEEANQGNAADRATMGGLASVLALGGTIFASIAAHRIWQHTQIIEPTNQEVALINPTQPEVTDSASTGIDLTGHTTGSYADLEVQQYEHKLRKETRAVYGQLLIENGLDPSGLDSDRPDAVATWPKASVANTMSTDPSAR